MMQSISQLAALTGKTRETVSKRLAAAGLKPTAGRGTAQEFESTVALPAIFEAVEGGGQGELMRAKVRNLDLDSQLKQQRRDLADGLVIPTEIVVRVWSGATNAARSQLLALPYRLAVACEKADFAAIQAKAQALIYETLECIAAFDMRDYYHSAPGETDAPTPALIQQMKSAE